VACVHRSDGDVRYALHVTPTGLAAIGIEPEPQPDEIGEGDQTNSPAPKRQTKAALLLSMLQREGGATLPELIAATGWLPHTTRAALTGLRKKGHTVERGKRDDATCYSIQAVA
jgi:hypothetical protein